MLRITVSKNSDAAKSYFEKALTKGDYYTEGHEIAGNWGGALAREMGLSGKVDKQQFDRLVENLNPVTGDTLTQRQKPNRRAGFDFTFNAPKSVSLTYAINKDENVLTAFREAVTETMAEIEQGMQARVRIKGKDEDRNTSNIAYAEFVHFTSRPVDGLPDPHLHSHVFVFNATHDKQENKYKAAQILKINQNAPYYEAVFHSRLSSKLTGLGYGTEKNGRFWEIAGYEQETLQKFSKRTKQIEEMAEELGINNDSSKSRLGATTRESKSLNLTQQELRQGWLDQMSEEERLRFDSLKKVSQEDTVTAREAVRHALDHLFERSSTIKENKIREEAMRYSFGTVTPEQIEDELLNTPLLRKTINGQKIVTTREVLAEEKSMVDFAYGGISMHEKLNYDCVIKRDFLSEEQRKAIQHILTSRDRVIAIQGKAGAGKTTLMQEAVEGINEGGRFVYTFAPSSDATDILRDEGFNNSNTVARLLIDDELQKSLENQVIWIDEAGLLSTKDMKAVFDIADKQNARVVLSGDTQQHSSVVRGDAFRILQKEARIKPAFIETIRRQKDETYRQAVMDIVNGEIEEGFQKLDEMNAVLEIDDDKERYKKLAGEYSLATSSGKSTLVVSPTHREGEKVTDAIRQELKETGVLNNKGIAYTSYKNLNFTGAEKKMPPTKDKEKIAKNTD